MQNFYANRPLATLVITLIIIVTANPSNYKGLAVVKYKLSQKVISFSFTNLQIEMAIEKLAIEHKIPIGLVSNSSYTLKKSDTFSLNARNQTVASLLDSITGLCSCYDWKELDGVINVTPRGDSYTPFFKEVMSAKLDYLKIDKRTPIYEVRYSLLNAIEVKKITSKYGFTSFSSQFGCGLFSCYLGSDPEYSAIFTDMTLNQILNYLAANSKMLFWKTYSHENYFSIFL